MKPGKPRAARSNGEAPEVTELHERPGADQEYRIELPAFEGPLDMLLHLIQKHELDILDIPIGFITEKYLEYLRLMQNLAIDVASEYLVMAATLAHIKSKMLLPAPPPGQDEDGDEESRLCGRHLGALTEEQREPAELHVCLQRLRAEEHGERPRRSAVVHRPVP